MVPAVSEAREGVGCWPEALPGTGRAGAASLPLPTLSLLQLDSEDAEPNFDEDGQDEYNELHMPV